MIDKTIELLAPAGNRESFVGAINAGANAIYLSGKNYGARKFADNFSKEEIAELIRYAHIRNVKVYVTINTLIFEDEIRELFDYSDFLVYNHVDALIVQDLGIIDAFCKRYPETEIHASTQMNTFNIYQLEMLKKLGVSRVILARETSVSDIELMKERVDIDLEVFVHGALCVSYSGNCLFSSMNGGRSGNRGECAQPCRLKYSLHRNDKLIEPDSYLISAKDLMTISNLDKIANSGVKSLKIEGRMRRPEYVIATVRAYREALDNIIEGKTFNINERISELLAVFNREYTKGYILNEEPYMINNSHRPNHLGTNVGKVVGFKHGKTTMVLNDTLRVGDGIRIIGDKDSGGQVGRIIKNDLIVKEAYLGDVITIDMPEEVSVGSQVMKTMDHQLESGLHSYLDEAMGIVDVDITLTAFINQKLSIKLKSDFTQEIVLESNYIIEKANTPSQDEGKLAKQISKLGNTPYKIRKLDILTDGLGFIPNGVINELRREAINLLEEKSLLRSKPIINNNNSKYQIKDNIEKSPKMAVRVETVEQYEIANKQDIDIIYITEKLAKSYVIDEADSPLISMNRIWYEEDKYKDFKNLLIRDIGGLIFQDKTELIADSTLNSTNSLTLETLYENGVRRIAIAPECSKDNTYRMIQSFRSNHGFVPNLEMIVYGKTDLMITKYCPITKSEGIYRQNCNMCEKYNYELINEKRDRFHLVRDGYCNLRILHHKPLNLIDYVQEILSMGIKTIRLDFTDESADETEKILKAFRNAIDNKTYEMPERFYTYGRFLR